MNKKVMILLFLSFVLLSCGKEEETVFLDKEKPEQTVLESDTESESESEPKAEPEPAPETEEKPEQRPEICVYICGAVTSPGVYFLEEGTRLFQGIQAAGGFLPEADREWWNQAELLTDGSMIRIYTREETEALRAEGKSSGEESLSGEESCEPAENGTGSRVNINTASREELKTIPGIGDARADAIVTYREEHGAFTSAEDVQKIPGIKGRIFEKIKEYISW